MGTSPIAQWLKELDPTWLSAVWVLALHLENHTGHIHVGTQTPDRTEQCTSRDCGVSTPHWGDSSLSPVLWLSPFHKYTCPLAIKEKEKGEREPMKWLWSSNSFSSVTSPVNDWYLVPWSSTSWVSVLHNIQLKVKMWEVTYEFCSEIFKKI